MQHQEPSVEEILDRAAHQPISSQELNILVNKTRQLSAERERQLQHLKSLLSELEAQLPHH